jgi:hypothetical protein
LGTSGLGQELLRQKQHYGNTIIPVTRNLFGFGIGLRHTAMHVFRQRPGSRLRSQPGPDYSPYQCGPTFCDTRTKLYNAANMAGRKQNTKIMAMVKIKSSNFNFKKLLRTNVGV